ncbi:MULTISPECIES: alpha-galactosidase [unclassified Leifsonia]|uniref:alpha-galactosidase n=1 Tax=unclassified Leifsonia TaxID=2663824 RepID=UPI0006F4D6F4|nr:MULTISPECIES: alpha-galactosidase [unclassified Leifsonia]KQX05387.1 alpha-galactosidase [Leifsonia sp. Root1293]KRA09020.1 alpha-galactosidase [Leifsonia sp. Root60]
MHHLRAAGVSLLLDTRGTGVPGIIHWGRDLGALSQSELIALAEASVPAVSPSSIDVPLRLSLLPSLRDGWSGRPALAVFRDGSLDLALRLRGVEASASGAASRLVITLTDAAGGVDVGIELELSAQGVLRVRHTVTNTADSALGLAAASVIVPVPDRAAEVLDFSGLWTHERRPQRRILGHGVWSRESRHGRPGHDNAYLLAAGTPGFGFRDGEVWATHLAWSGDGVVWAERSPLGPATIGAGELLAPGELSLAAGASYLSPWSVFVYSDSGLDGISDRLHPWVRSWSTIRSKRPVILNTWEAVYFDHSLERLTPLVDAAAEVGVERFVLDDGWFTGRSDDRRALGDWFVDPAAWPDGLHPLIQRVAASGMDFGLWVEPEMVNRDSDVARAHPDWIIGAADAITWRWQNVLDLDNPDAFSYVFGRLDALLAEYPIAYLKWDHNRDLLGGSAHRQTAALYRLIDAVRSAHPNVEIESCASGGGRIDLGILERTDRVWVSDTNDPLERQSIQRYTSLVVPPEYLGGHLGIARAHTTGRTAALSFRLATALFGHAGIEWNIAEATPAERASVAEWIAVYKRERGLLHSGRVVRADASDSAIVCSGVVGADGSRALFSYAALTAPAAAIPAPQRFPGLDAARSYRVRPLVLGTDVFAVQDAAPAWWAAGEVVLPGALLGEVGLPMPLIAPENTVLVEFDAVG